MFPECHVRIKVEEVQDAIGKVSAWKKSLADHEEELQ